MNNTVSPRLLTAVSDGLDYMHRDPPFEDFAVLPLLPYKLSTQGPALAVSDVNGDGVQDLYLGGAHEQAGQLFIQTDGGSFTLAHTFREFAASEEVDATFLDVDGDGDPDLYTVHGGWQGPDSLLQDRLYMNKGHGEFVAAPLPEMAENGCCVAPADYDEDGDVDLFVGSRSTPRGYGQSPRSYLLKNDGTGTFTIAHEPALEAPGMITGAAWANVTGDGRVDLVLVGEWMPVTVFENVRGRLLNVTDSLGLAQTRGLWQSLLAEDVDGDGDVDLVTGNLGTNSVLRPPLRLIVLDSDQNGIIDPVVAVRKEDQWYSWALRDALLRQIPGLASVLPTYHSYADKTLRDLFSDETLATANIKNVDVLASSLFINNSGRGFTPYALPDPVQWAPVMAIETADPDSDGQREVLLAGNLLGANDAQGPYDASFGHVLRFRGGGRFEYVRDSGFLVRGEVRAIHALQGKDGRIIIGRNNASAMVFEAHPDQE